MSEIVEAYIAAWNEPDDARRDALPMVGIFGPSPEDRD